MTTTRRYRYQIRDNALGHTLTAEDFADRAAAQARADALNTTEPPNQRYIHNRAWKRRYTVAAVTIPAE